MGDASSSLPAKQKYYVKSLLGYFLVIVSILLCDLGTKYLSEKNFMLSSSPDHIHAYLAGSKPVFVLGSSANWLDFSITYVRNTGAAWGVLGGLPENIRPYFFALLTIIVMIIILIFFLKTDPRQILVRLGIAFILSGALGNFIDRVSLHYVIDWLHFQWKIWGWSYDYPVFNVADSAIVSGVILLIIDGLISEIQAYKLKKKGKSDHGTAIP